MNGSHEAARHDARALIFLLSAAVEDAFQDELSLVVDHSYLDGYFCFLKEEQPVQPRTLETLERMMRHLMTESNQIKLKPVNGTLKSELELPQGEEARLSLLELDGYRSLSFEFTTTDLSDLPTWCLEVYANGFLLRIGAGKEDPPPALVDSPKLFAVMRENESWGEILEVSSIHDLNQKVQSVGFKEMIWVAEALQEKRIAAIADAIHSQPETRIVLVAGPSSSGKTTFMKKLGIHLLVNGLRTRMVSMDDYFLDRDQMQVEADGTLDYEQISCLDQEGLRSDMKRLIYGEPIHLREYDFHEGRSAILPDQILLEKNEILVLEGIHGLNPVLGHGIPQESLFKIYISALTQLNIDDKHPISTSDGRLLRRIVRDHHFRGYSAEETMKRWNSVRHGELRNIFPYQELADVMFNSALVYEMAILKRYAFPLIKDAAPNTLRDRLLTLLSLFHAIPEQHVPGTSLLREFIGNSYFTY